MEKAPPSATNKYSTESPPERPASDAPEPIFSTGNVVSSSHSNLEKSKPAPSSTGSSEHRLVVPPPPPRSRRKPIATQTNNYESSKNRPGFNTENHSNFTPVHTVNDGYNSVTHRREDAALLTVILCLIMPPVGILRLPFCHKNWEITLKVFFAGVACLALFSWIVAASIYFYEDPFDAFDLIFDGTADVLRNLVYQFI